MQGLTEIFKTINISYVVLMFSFFIAFLTFIYKHKLNTKYLNTYIIIFVAVMWILFFLLNDTLNLIFSFNFLSVRLYLFLVIIINMITLFTINYNFSKIYKLPNYLLFIVSIIIFLANSILVILKLQNINIKFLDIDNVVLMDVNFIAFVTYLIIICQIYTINCLSAIVSKKTSVLKTKICQIKKLPFVHKKKRGAAPQIKKTKKPALEIVEPLSNKESQISSDENAFYIDGVDCSIIFEDSNRDDIIKNYYILLHDVHARLVNGYTLDEYKRIKNIINKLNIKDLNNINIDMNSLNKITLDEYNILKDYLSTREYNN